MPGGLPGGGGWAVLELTGALHVKPKKKRIRHLLSNCNGGRHMVNIQGMFAVWV